MPYSYITVDALKGTGALNATGTAYDSRLRAITEAISQEFDRYTNRVIHPIVGTRFFNGDGGTELIVDDLISVGTILEDSNDDGTFDTGWATSDYFLEPYNADPTSIYGRPYTSLAVSLKANGSQDVFIAGQRNYSISGTWGFVASLGTSVAVASADHSATVTQLDLGGSVSTSTLGIGASLLIGAEQMYVTNVGTAGTSVTVIRGVNGSTAGSFGSGTTIQQYQYPPAISEAVMIQAGRIWKRKDSGFASQVGIPETGQMIVFTGGIDPDVRLLLNPYRKPVI